MDMSMFSLNGKIALITGGSYGIGFAIAEGLQAAVATIVFNDINAELVKNGMKAYSEKGITAHGYGHTGLDRTIHGRCGLSERKAKMRLD